MKTDLLNIPYVGKNTKKDLLKLGITCVEDLKNKNPRELYLKNCKQKGYSIDRCQLYVFRMSVYYAECEKPDAKKLKWWYWKDKEYPEETKEKTNG